MKKFANSVFAVLFFFIFACDNTMMMVDKADAYYSSGEYAKAEPIYLQVLSKDPNQPYALKGLGNIKLSQKDYPAAIDYYKKTVEIRPELASAELVSFLAYREENIRKAILGAISSLNNGKDAVVREMVSRIKQSNQYSMVDYLDALKGAGSSVSIVIADIVPLLEHQYDEVKKSALETLSVASPAKLKENNAVLKMAELIKNPDISVSSTAFKSLSSLKTGASQAIPAIIKELTNGKIEIRKAAREALAEIGAGNSDAVPGLVELLPASNAKEIRIAAMDSLSLMGANAGGAIYALIPLTQDADTDIKIIAATTMSKIGKPSEASVANIAALLKNENVNIQMHAIRELAEMGKDAAAAVTPLSVLVQTSDNNEVRKEAQKAVEKINQTTAQI
ncbi:MAG: HEAT repeat domain-containing protein [Endomicrobium sp.]|nr:HEAT repeat domain-containing protein [Endomicrobium sp.]